MKKVIELRNVSKQFDGETVLDSINLDIYDNEFLTLLGPSGCGKTTTLRMIGGFETPDQGDILFLGERINDIPPHKRNINTVFQRYALFPHLNVFENVAFPLREQKLPRNEIEQKVNEMLALVKLTGFERRNVTRLSGGQQQRVAIARALVSRPRVLLLDEPLAALDLKLRKDMQQELKNIQKATGITFVFVTHDQEEALSMSDTIVVMSEGKIQQIGTPLDIYNAAECFRGGFHRREQHCRRHYASGLPRDVLGPYVHMRGQGLCQKRERGRRHPPRGCGHRAHRKGHAARHGHVRHVHGRAL